MVAQWLRQLSIVITDKSTGGGRELITPVTPEGDALHVVFRITHAVIETPVTLALRVFNVSRDTAAFMLRLGLTPEAIVGGAGTLGANTNGQVVVKAGYPGNFGTVFTGNVKQVRVGRVNPTDTYVDVFATDSDLMRNWGVVNRTLAAGHTQTDVYNTMVQALAPYGGKAGNFDLPRTYNPADVPVPPPPNALRGRAYFGMVRDYCRDLAAAYNATWNTTNGQLNFLSRSAYAPGDIAVITADTGMIGLPQQTQNGITVRVLLNPTIGIGSRIKLDNAAIQRQVANFGIGAINTFPAIDADGIYKVIYVDQQGDNRGQDWYSDLTCLSVDPSALLPPGFGTNLTGASAAAVAGVQDVGTGIPP